MSSTASSRTRPSSSRPSTANLSVATATSLRSSHRQPPPLTTVITIPPWARDEPPSPNEQTSFIETHHTTEYRPSDVASDHSHSSNPGSRWWALILPPYRDTPPSVATVKPERERRGFTGRSMSWLPTSATMREGPSFTRRGDKEKDPETGPTHDMNASIAIPTPAVAPSTVAHNASPGWDIPWTPRAEPRRNSYGFGAQMQDDDTASDKCLNVWQRRKKKLRAFILINTYVPLLFRFINITFTTAALGMAIRIRKIELKNHAMGAVGSSPTVVIIFAPLTLVHVMAAIYLEYFGRPLGLWRTSAKLTHTLSEVLFICAWSAALSLCFDNFFTSLIPCASPSSMSWYNELPRPPNGLPNFEGTIGDRICDDQLALICLVGVGLSVYCINLVISLFRIFEKVKYHPAAPFRSS